MGGEMGPLANADYPEKIAGLKERQALGLKDRVQFYVAQPNNGRRFVKVDAGWNQSAQVTPMLRRPLVQAFDRAGANHDADNRPGECRLREPVQNPR
jgi:hypothetical protein